MSKILQVFSQFLGYYFVNINVCLIGHLASPDRFKNITYLSIIDNLFAIFIAKYITLSIKDSIFE